MLPEDAFESEAVAQSGAPRRLVQSVALPLEASIPEVIEHVFGDQVQRLCPTSRLLQRRPEQNVAHLNASVYGFNAHEGQIAYGNVLIVQNGEEERILFSSFAIQV